MAGMEVLVAVPLELLFKCRPKQEAMRRGLSIVLSLMQKAGLVSFEGLLGRLRSEIRRIAGRQE